VEDLPGDHSSTTAPASDAGWGITAGACCCDCRPLERGPPRGFLPRAPLSRLSRVPGEGSAGASALCGMVMVSTTGSAGGVGITGATGSAGAGSTTASATFLTAFFRTAPGFLAAFGAAFLAGSSGSSAFGAAAFLDAAALGLRGAAGDAADFRRTVFLGVSSSGNNDGVSVDSVITKL